jgi:hypothetical protein
VPFDIVFLSHNEPTADKNFELLKTKFSRAKRVSGVTGIHQAHIKAAEISETEMFFVVDADAIIKDDFNFDIDQIPRYDHIALENFRKTVFIWQSENPINGLVYGYGGVKLLPRDLTLNMDLEKTDVTTGISENIKLMNSVSNITAFNYDEFSTWRSAFRECVKLASRVIDRSYDQESDHRLAMWCKNGEDKPFGSYAIKGAIAGRRYGVLNIGKTEKLNKINDYEWLRERFEESVNK